MRLFFGYFLDTCSTGAFVGDYCGIKRISESFQPKVDRFVSIVSAMNAENQ